MRSIDAYLTEYAQGIVRRWDDRDARRYLRECVRLWRSEYGPEVAEKCAMNIAQMFKEQKR